VTWQGGRQRCALEQLADRSRCRLDIGYQSSVAESKKLVVWGGFS